MKSKFWIKLSVILFPMILFFVLLAYTNASAQTKNVCLEHPNKQWAWTVNSPWMSTNKTGDWKTDTWFYYLKPGEAVIVTQTDAKLGYYLVCYDFGGDRGLQPLVGW